MIDAAKAKALWDEGVLFVDVRPDKDWEVGRIPSALHLDLDGDLSEKALFEEVGKDEPTATASIAPAAPRPVQKP